MFNKAGILIRKGISYPGTGFILLHPPYGMDIGFELGFIFTGVAYFYLRRAELAVSNR